MQTVVNTRLKPIAKAWSDIYSELTDTTEDAPPTEIYSALDKVCQSIHTPSIAFRLTTTSVSMNIGQPFKKSPKV